MYGVCIYISLCAYIYNIIYIYIYMCVYIYIYIYMTIYTFYYFYIIKRKKEHASVCLCVYVFVCALGLGHTLNIFKLDFFSLKSVHDTSCIHIYLSIYLSISYIEINLITCIVVEALQSMTCSISLCPLLLSFSFSINRHTYIHTYIYRESGREGERKKRQQETDTE